MKSLKESLLDDDLAGETDKLIKDEILIFVKKNYYGANTRSCKISEMPNKDGKYEVSANKSIIFKKKKQTSLTNGMFIWDKIDGDFICMEHNDLISLEGAPKIVTGDFICSHCKSLESLKDAPEKVGRDFHCSYCSSIESFEGAPKRVGRDFECYDCSSLESLEGSPKRVGRDFSCMGSKVKFTKEDIKKVSNVKGYINC